MKNSDIERMLRNELERSAPSDFNDIRRRCGLNSVAEAVPITAGANVNDHSLSKNRVRIISLILLFCILLGAVALILTILPQNDGLLKPLGSGYFVIDINPTLEIHYDKNGKITDVKPLNEDAEVLLSDLTLIGKSYDKATDLIFMRCVELGYFSYDRETNAMLASAHLDSGSADEAMTKEIKKLLSNAFSSYKMRGVVITGVHDPALAEQASNYGIDAQKYALILNYLSIGGTIGTEKYRDISISELYSLISDKQKEIKKQSIDEKKSASTDYVNALSATLLEKINQICDAIEELSDNNASDNSHGKDTKVNNSYTDNLSHLRSFLKRLEQPKTEEHIKQIAIDFLSELTDIKNKLKDHELVTVIDSVYIEVNKMLADLQVLISEINGMSLTPSETSGKRKDKFSSVQKPQKEDNELNNWQNNHESEYITDWFKLKNSWQSERSHDLY